MNYRRLDPKSEVQVQPALQFCDGEEPKIGGTVVRCIAAPGHASRLMVFEIAIADERVWFCGDLVEIGPECKTVQLGVEHKAPEVDFALAWV